MELGMKLACQTNQLKSPVKFDTLLVYANLKCNQATDRPPKPPIQSRRLLLLEEVKPAVKCESEWFGITPRRLQNLIEWNDGLLKSRSQDPLASSALLPSFRTLRRTPTGMAEKFVATVLLIRKSSRISFLEASALEQNECLLNLQMINMKVKNEVHNQIKFSAKGAPPHAADPPHLAIQVVPPQEVPQKLTQLQLPTTWPSIRPHPHHCPSVSWAGCGEGCPAAGQQQHSPWLLKLASGGAVASLALPHWQCCWHSVVDSLSSPSFDRVWILC